MYRMFHPKIAEYIFFSSVHGTFSRIDHMTGHKTTAVNLRRLYILAMAIRLVKEIKNNPSSPKWLPPVYQSPGGVPAASCL